MGRKREGASSAVPLAGPKRRRRERASGDWASLPSDIVQLVTDRLLDGGDVADYVHVRAVCSHWRTSKESIDLNADSWIALCGGNAVRRDDACEIDLFHTRTARRLRVRLQKLRGYRIVCFSAGHLVLLQKKTAVVRVFHPLTRVAVDFPSLAPMYSEEIRQRSFVRDMRAAVCRAASTPSSIAVLVWFQDKHAVVAAEAGSDKWDVIHRDLYPAYRNSLVFQGRLYSTMEHSFEIVELYPSKPQGPVGLGPPAAVAHIPSIFGHRMSGKVFLIESGGKMLLVVRHDNVDASASLATEWWLRLGFTIYEVDLNNNGLGKLMPVSSLGDRVLFLGDDGCVSVSVGNLPSLSRNSIYFSVDSHPVVMHSLTTGLSEELVAECQIHDGQKRIRPSVRPFTIADHLLTFCHPQEWTKGLMFHEYHVIPKSFKELWRKIKAKESQLGFRQTPSSIEKNKQTLGRRKQKLRR